MIIHLWNYCKILLNRRNLINMCVNYNFSNTCKGTSHANKVYSTYIGANRVLELRGRKSISNRIAASWQIVYLELQICCYFLQFIVNKLRCCFGIPFSSRCALTNTKVSIAYDYIMSQYAEWNWQANLNYAPTSPWDKVWVSVTVIYSP